jgi:hypothetical protein
MTFPAALAGILGGILAAGAVGFGIARFFTGGLARTEIVAWSFATGLLVQSLLFLAVAAVSPGAGLAPLLALDALVVSVALLIAPPRTPGSGSDRPRWTGLVRVLLFVAAAAWLVFLVQAVAEPMWSTDYLAIWGLKGKTIATTGHVPRRLFSDPALYWAHREYPLLLPVSLAALAPFAGGWDDQALALFFPICELATLLALFGFLARRVSREAGAAAAALAALCFPLYRAVNAGTAEIPFAFAVVLVAAAFLDALDRGSPRVRARLFAAALFCVSIKQEGTLWVGLLGLALLFRRRTRRDAWALFVPPVLHWTALYFLRGPQTRRDFDLTLFEPGRWKELPSLFGTVVGRMITTEARQAWIPLVAIALFLIVTKRGVGDPLLPIFPLQILCYAVAFSVSSFDPIYAIEGAFRRIALTLFPALTIALAARAVPFRDYDRGTTVTS